MKIYLSDGLVGWFDPANPSVLKAIAVSYMNAAYVDGDNIAGNWEKYPSHIYTLGQISIEHDFKSGEPLAIKFKLNKTVPVPDRWIDDRKD